MPDTATVTVNATALGRSFTTDWTVTGDSPAGSSPNVTPAAAGTLTTRTDNDTGSVTMSAGGHGITTAAEVDVYWSGGARRDMTVGTVSGTTVPIDGGLGDNLPAATTALTLKVPQTEGELDVTGANVTFIALKATTYRGTIVLREADGTEILAKVIPAGESYVWSADSGETNPVTGVSIAKATFSHEDASNTQEMPWVLLYN
ncbi:MAG TPA: hypothetical protein VD866_03105 [Urbifossiella sp.]|nr:hypothetical protein [Urbifossiella sp.]